MNTIITSAARAKRRVVVATPPVFAIFCLLIWAAALFAVVTHQGAIETMPFIGP